MASSKAAPVVPPSPVLPPAPPTPPVPLAPSDPVAPSIPSIPPAPLIEPDATPVPVSRTVPFEPFPTMSVALNAPAYNGSKYICQTHIVEDVHEAQSKIPKDTLPMMVGIPRTSATPIPTAVICKSADRSPTATAPKSSADGLTESAETASSGPLIGTVVVPPIPPAAVVPAIAPPFGGGLFPLSSELFAPQPMTTNVAISKHVLHLIVTSN